VDEPGREPDDLIDRVAAELRAPVALTGEQVDRIMASVRAGAAAHRPGRRRRVAAWMWGSVATLGVAAALVLLLPRAAQSPVPVGPTVEFSLSSTTARQVTVVGDFNHWDVRATPLRRPAADGRWHAAVRLAPGRHVYAFVVDGVQWVPDPAAPRAVDDDFGSPNSVLTVLPVRGST
jgi:AMP-activated protein kinase-like protein